MGKSFLCRRTSSGTEAMKNAIEHVRRDLRRAEKRYGWKSLEASEPLLLLGALNYVAKDYARAEPLVARYVAIAQKKVPSNPADTFWGLTLLSDIYADLNRFAKCLEAGAKAKLLSYRPDPSAVDTLSEILVKRVFACSDENTTEGHRRTFIFGLVALCWCVTHGFHRCAAGTKVMNKLVPVFESYGIDHEQWEWVVKHAHLTKYDFVGLLSILLRHTGLDCGGFEPWVDQEIRVIEVRKGGLVRWG
jgi:hypothetical protein